MQIYVAGKMRGMPYMNYPAFDAATAMLREKGHIVRCPAEHSRSLGFSEITCTSYDKDGHPQEFDIKAAIMWDLNAVADSDAIYLLRGWESSPGANIERALALFLNKEIIEQ